MFLELGPALLDTWMALWRTAKFYKGFTTPYDKFLKGIIVRDEYSLVSFT